MASPDDAQRMTKYRYSWATTGMKKDPEGSWVLQSDAHEPPFTIGRYESLGECIMAERDWLRGQLNFANREPPHCPSCNCGAPEPNPAQGDYAVRCRCGWMGKTSRLKSLPEFKWGCPECSAVFTPIELGQRPEKSEGGQ